MFRIDASESVRRKCAKPKRIRAVSYGKRAHIYKAYNVAATSIKTAHLHESFFFVVAQFFMCEREDDEQLENSIVVTHSDTFCSSEKKCVQQKQPFTLWFTLGGGKFQIYFHSKSDSTTKKVDWIEIESRKFQIFRHVFILSMISISGDDGQIYNVRLMCKHATHKLFTPTRFDRPDLFVQYRES